MCGKASHQHGQTWGSPSRGRNLSRKPEETLVIFPHFLRGSLEAAFTELLVSMATPFLSDDFTGLARFQLKLLLILGEGLCRARRPPRDSTRSRLSHSDTSPTSAQKFT